MNKCYDQGLNSLFKPEFNYELCNGCAQCARECSFNEIKIILKNGEKLPAANQSSCGACHRCELTCPKRAITIVDRPFPLRANKLWDYKSVNRVHLQAASGAVILTGMGADNDLPNYFDRITFNAWIKSFKSSIE